MKNKKGFTLGEIMIAIGILGVLAALLIPALMNSQPDQSKVMFKKAYSTLEQNISELINDDTNYPAKDCTIGATTVNCGFNNNGLAGTLVPAGNNKLCYLMSDKMNTTTSDCAQAGGDWGAFTTNDGISWTLTAQTFPLDQNSYNVKFLIDVNGPKGPNCTLDNNTGGGWGSDWRYTAGCKSPDRFIVGVRYDGKLQIGCSSLPNCNATTDQNAINILLNPTNNKRN